MTALRVVDRPGWDAIECSRCGECCTKFQPTTDGDDQLWWNYAGPLGWLELYCYRLRHYAEDGFGITPYGRDGDPDLWDSMVWFGQLEATLNEYGNWYYSCGHFERDIEGLGVCTIYEDRPGMCSRFPYEAEDKQDRTYWDKCTWNVEFIEFEVVEA